MRPWAIYVITLPVGPVSDVFEIIIKPPILQVLCAQETISSASIYKVLKADRSRSAVFACPRRRDGLARIQGPDTISILTTNLFKLDRTDLDLVKNASTTDPGVPEEQVIGFRSEQVPGISFRTACLKKIGV